MRTLEHLVLYATLTIINEEPNRVVALEKMRQISHLMDPAEARLLLTHLALPMDLHVFPPAPLSLGACTLNQILWWTNSTSEHAGDADDTPATEVVMHRTAVGPYLTQAALETFVEHFKELAVRSAIHESMWLALLEQVSRLQRIVLEDDAALRSLCWASGILLALSVLVITGVDFKKQWAASDGTAGAGKQCPSSVLRNSRC
ncbi:hypothetical protein FA95DRAFT_1610177 [Auriscalpium vulgare]|uniref:Uncharacterized protein n=1 Tax=Auriscalpium vulgare TaxID=40419 RepID=A0ACB8RE77_9AGAM|nr:hypothetical protein FA95DRAFT_1610177 [Auriscalpium vulgare]